MKQRENRNFSSIFFTMGIVTLFFGGFLLLVVFGATSYRSVIATQQDNNHTRVLLSYLSNTMQAHKLSVITTYEDANAESTVLNIEDVDPLYAFRIYNYKGHLVEDYGENGGELFPEDANVLGENLTLEFESVNDRLIKITTSQGSTYVKVYHFEGGQ